MPASCRVAYGFTPAEARLVGRLAANLGNGCRLSHAGPGDEGIAAIAPGVVVLHPDRTLAAITGEAEHLLAQIPDHSSNSGRLPAAIYAAAACLQSINNGTAFPVASPTVRARAMTGDWLLVHATHLHGSVDDIAVIIERPTSPFRDTVESTSVQSAGSGFRCSRLVSGGLGLSLGRLGEGGGERVGQAARILGRNGLDQIRLDQRHGALVGLVTPESGGQIIGSPTRARDGKHRSASGQAALDVRVSDLATVDKHRGRGCVAGQHGRHPGDPTRFGAPLIAGHQQEVAVIRVEHCRVVLARLGAGQHHRPDRGHPNEGEVQASVGADLAEQPHDAGPGAAIDRDQAEARDHGNKA
jgi:hypothetical protein